MITLWYVTGAGDTSNLKAKSAPVSFAVRINGLIPDVYHTSLGLGSLLKDAYAEAEHRFRFRHNGGLG